MTEDFHVEGSRCDVNPFLTSPASVCLRTWQHPVDSVGVTASLSAVLPQLTDVRQRVQGTAKICFPRLGIWLIFAGTIPP